MDLDWKVFGIIALCLIALALVFYLIQKNMKDKKDVTRLFNEEDDLSSKRNVHGDNDEI